MVVYVVTPRDVTIVSDVAETEKCIEGHKQEPEIAFACHIARKYLENPRGQVMLAVSVSDTVLTTIVSSIPITSDKARKLCKILLDLKRKSERNTIDIIDIVHVIGGILEVTGYRELLLTMKKDKDMLVLAWIEV